MKARKLIYVAVMAASLGWMSCSDNMLDKKPLNAYSELDVFEDEALLTNFVNGTYRGLRHSFDDENSLTDGLTDNAFNQHGSAVGTITNYTHAEVSQDNGEGITRNLWSNAYSYIRRTNLFFEKTETSSVDADALKGLQGEMQFLRAYFYFDLLRWYGGVPLITTSFELDDASFDVARNSADEVAAFIVKECDEAITKLPAMANADQGRATVEAAMALKARTLLYAASPLFNAANSQEKWTAARDANKAVMDLSGVSLITPGESYNDIFSGDNTKEIIFARYFTSTNNQGWGINLWLYSNGFGGWNTTTPTQDLVDTYEMVDGKLPSDPTSTYDDQNPYVDRDPRFYESILYNGAPFKGRTYDYYLDKANPGDATKAGRDSRNGTSAHNASRTGYSFRKYTEEDKPAEGSGSNAVTNPFIFFRKSEFYLNYAEAQIALGNEDEAKNAINAVRARVNMPAVTESGDALVERYRRERRVELVLEDHRFFDIRRWKIGPEALNKPATGVDVYNNNGTMEYIYGMVADDDRKWHDRMYLLPIPAAEIQRSHNKLVQNDGYAQ